MEYSQYLPGSSLQSHHQGYDLTALRDFYRRKTPHWEWWRRSLGSESKIQKWSVLSHGHHMMLEALMDMNKKSDEQWVWGLRFRLTEKFFQDCTFWQMLSCRRKQRESIWQVYCHCLKKLCRTDENGSSVLFTRKKLKLNFVKQLNWYLWVFIIS